MLTAYAQWICSAVQNAGDYHQKVDALNAPLRALQGRFKQPHGDVAGQFFDGPTTRDIVRYADADRPDLVRVILTAYLICERQYLRTQEQRDLLAAILHPKG
jgi:hypothetical protein